QALGDQLRAAVDEPRLLRAVQQRAARDFLVVGFVGLAEIRGVGEGNRAVRPHPVKRRARVEAAGKRDADVLAGGKTLKDGSQRIYFTSTSSSASRLGPSIITARVSPSLYGCSRNLTPSPRSLATHASRFGTLSAM